MADISKERAVQLACQAGIADGDFDFQMVSVSDLQRFAQLLLSKQEHISVAAFDRQFAHSEELAAQVLALKDRLGALQTHNTFLSDIQARTEAENVALRSQPVQGDLAEMAAELRKHAAAYPYLEIFTRAANSLEAAFKLGRNAGLEEAKQEAKETCSHDATLFGDGFNTAALVIERAIKSLKDNTP